MTKRRHHYIPQFYLKNFIDPNNSPYIWVYDKEGAVIIKSTKRKKGSDLQMLDRLGIGGSRYLSLSPELLVGHYLSRRRGREAVVFVGQPIEILKVA